MVIVQVRLYPRVGLGQSIMEPTLMPVVCRAIRYANCGLNERTGEMLIKNFPFPSKPPSSFSFFLYFFIPLFPSFLPAMAKESGGALKLLSRSGQNTAVNQHLLNFRLKECFW